ncbi:MAG TPA: helix-turn-helix domain-containing protein [Ignavibacteriaceae bacterium]|nr:helix-turn-helix domain-containing protein [Ignavibacteriaceae bacterium]
MRKKDILIIENLAQFERDINRDKQPYDLNMMVMPGTLEDKHKDVDPKKGIQALRRRFNLIYLIMNGIHDVHLGAEYRWLKPNDLVIVPENMLYASSNVKGCIGYCIHFKTEFIQPLLKESLTNEFPFFNLDAEHIINITEKEAEIIKQAFKDIISEYENFSTEKDYILRNYIHILLLRIREIYKPYMNKLKENLSRSEILANRFKHELEKNFLSMRKVQDYAEKFHISTKHLSDVVQETFGKSPRDMINDMLLLEIKVQLGATDKTVSEIAHDLNFYDQSHLNHFMKQHTGSTPTEYRENFSSNKDEAKFLSGNS